MFTVTASHVSADYDSLIKQTTFAENTEYRVRGDGEHGFYASGPLLGCGRTCRTKELAIQDLLAANGYTSIHIEHSQPVRAHTTLIVQETYGPDYYVYRGQKLVGVYPSESMARSVIAREES